MKRVLITGANSYIGTSFEKYAAGNYADDLQVDTIDMMGDEWRKEDFGKYDIVYHVAGIAHNYVGKVSEEVKQGYYAVNTELAIETAKKAKREGVKQFVFMSSIIVYGDSAPYGKKKMITKDTIPQPSNFYGDSKWQADKGIRELDDDNFMVTVIRPPMIYGKGSKGNYPTLSKMAKKMPIFPSVTNERSMLYIDNLCEFLCQVMVQNKGGVFWPQNSEYTRTAEMVQQIADVIGHKMLISKFFNFAVLIASKMPGKIGDLTNKAFGNMTYDKEMSRYDFQYQKVDFRTSIKKTEGM